MSNNGRFSYDEATLARVFNQYMQAMGRDDLSDREFYVVPLSGDFGGSGGAGRYQSLLDSADSADDKENKKETELPTLLFDTTFVISNGKQVDEDVFAEGLLKTRFEKNVIPSKLKAIQTLGDGRCFLHAVSMFLMGSDQYDNELRSLILGEVLENEEFYMSTVVAAHMELFKDDPDLKDEKKKAEKEQELFQSLVSSCEGKGSFRQNWMGMEEAFVLANAIKRPIIVYASKDDVLKYGEGISGVGGAFLPLRHKPEECVSRQPVLISWTALGVHFCPVVRVSDWDDTQKSTIAFPAVRPALVDHCELGDPMNSSDSLSATETEMMSKYVNYDEPVKKPPVIKKAGPRTADIFSSEPIKGFAKTLCPEDNRMYDIVIPVDVGSTVAYIAFDLGEEYMPSIRHVAEKYCQNDSFCLVSMVEYVQRVLYNIRVDKSRRSSEGYIPCLVDFVPLKLVPSIPSENSDLKYLTESLGSSPSIPVAVPCRFSEEVSDRAIGGLMETLAEKCGQESNTYVECLCLLREFMSNSFLVRSTDGSATPSVKPHVRHDLCLPKFASCCDYKSFELFELFRYLALNPILCSFFGPVLTDWCVVPDEKDSFCVHVAFIKMLTNILTCLPAIDVTSSNDVYKDITESKDFMQYFEKASKSRSPELLLPLSILFLDIGVMNYFSPLDVVVARYYPRILLTALRLEHVSLLRNILIGMATLMYNDKNTMTVFKSCRPLQSLLSEVEHIPGAESVVPYANFCNSAIEEAKLED